jgi:hypothetical protein
MNFTSPSSSTIYAEPQEIETAEMDPWTRGVVERLMEPPLEASLEVLTADQVEWFIKLKPRAVAEQLAIMEYERRDGDMLIEALGWLNGATPHAPQFNHIIAFPQKVSEWVQYLLLTVKLESPLRIKLAKFFVKISYESREIKSFSVSAAIITGLTTKNIAPLKLINEGSDETLKMQKVQGYFKDSYKRYLPEITELRTKRDPHLPILDDLALHKQTFQSVVGGQGDSNPERCRSFFERLAQDVEQYKGIMPKRLPSRNIQIINFITPRFPGVPLSSDEKKKRCLEILGRPNSSIGPWITG